MRLPLYAAKDFPDEFKDYKEYFNAGLWYNKFCHTWKNKWELGAEEKLAWINKLITKDKKTRLIGSERLLALGIERLKELVKANGGTCFYYETETRFVTGLGLEHPVENGFLWHTTLGVPYIPGSSVKGLLRNWVKQWKQKDDETVSRIFGSSSGEEEGRGVGSVIFFDALPVRPVLLEADIMTPHYAPYYSNPKDTDMAPGDWYGPTPIPFLTVAPGQEFLFAVAPRGKDNVGDLEHVSKWLTKALSCVGMGAKTAIGYGRFKLLKAEKASVLKVVDTEAIVEEAVDDPILREMIGDGYNEPASTGTFLKVFDKKWKVRLTDENVPIEEKKQIARLIIQWYQEKSPEQLRKPNKKNKEKLKIVNKYLA